MTEMILNRPSLLNTAAALSLAVSIALGILPFFHPNTPIGPFLGLNWALFMTVGYLASRPLAGPAHSKKSVKRNLHVFLLVLISFAFVGWLAILNGAMIY